MKKRITVAVAVTLFLVQAIPMPGIAPAENLSPNPMAAINSGGADLQFKDTCSFLCMALSLYRSDVLKGMPKEELLEAYGPIFSGSGIHFDLDHIDLMRKGCTRYYPFSVGENRFVARIFLTKEAGFQPKIQVISELTIENFGVTIQILPGIDQILNDCKIVPNKPCQSSLTDKSV